MNRPIMVLAALVATVLSACAVTPRVSTWNSPERLKKAEVFNAALQAGAQNGMQTTASDREAGTMSFTKQTGKGQMILSVTVMDRGNVVQVRTTASHGGGLAIAGLQEEFIQNFHVVLFRNLNISDPSERKINVELMK
jgi:hypothetical protein